MGRIVSIHEYDLKPEINDGQFEQVLRDAEARGLLQLPGLVARPGRSGRKNFSLPFCRTTRTRSDLQLTNSWRDSVLSVHSVGKEVSWKRTSKR
jgi:hypothetical protein